LAGISKRWAKAALRLNAVSMIVMNRNMFIYSSKGTEDIVKYHDEKPSARQGIHRPDQQDVSRRCVDSLPAEYSQYFDSGFSTLEISFLVFSGMNFVKLLISLKGVLN
jgi:hypothetical protein